MYLPSHDAVEKIVARAVLIRFVMEAWGDAATYAQAIEQ